MISSLDPRLTETSSIEASKARLGIRAKLIMSYLAVGLALAALNVVATHWVQERTAKAATARTVTLSAAEGFLGDVGSAFEEGFGYLLSADGAEREACLAKLATLDRGIGALLQRSDMDDDRRVPLQALRETTELAAESARQMFDDYESDHKVHDPSYKAYEASMDNASARVRLVIASMQQRGLDDEHTAHRRTRYVILGIAVAATLLAVLVGGAFGHRLTRPLIDLRDAAVSLGHGDLVFVAGARSNDELGEVARAFDEMATKTRRLLSTVADQKRRLEDVFSSMGEMLVVCHLDGTIGAVNNSVCTLLGYTQVELVGAPLDVLFDSLSVEDLRAQARQKGNADRDVFMRRKDGREVVVSLSAYPLKAEGDDFAGIICVALDMSDKRHLEAELRQAQKLEAVGRLASGIAHEINTPVQFVNDSLHFIAKASSELVAIVERYRAIRDKDPSAVLGALQEAAREEDQADYAYIQKRLPRAVERSIEGLARVSSIVRSIKEFAHPDQKTQTATDLNAAIQTTLTIARNEYKYVADVETEFAALPLVTCYSGELNQVVLNIVVNAAHAIEDKVKGTDARGRITVRTGIDGDDAVVSIGDTGGGIPDRIRDKIFDPFFTTKEVGRGTGQGLAIARSVIEKHGGVMSFETHPGEGTTFFLRIPLHGKSVEPLASSPRRISA